MCYTDLYGKLSKLFKCNSVVRNGGLGRYEYLANPSGLRKQYSNICQWTSVVHNGGLGRYEDLAKPLRAESLQDANTPLQAIRALPNAGHPGHNTQMLRLVSQAGSRMPRWCLAKGHTTDAGSGHQRRAFPKGTKMRPKNTRFLMCQRHRQGNLMPTQPYSGHDAHHTCEAHIMFHIIFRILHVVDFQVCHEGDIPGILSGCSTERAILRHKTSPWQNSDCHKFDEPKLDSRVYA